MRHVRLRPHHWLLALGCISLSACVPSPATPADAQAVPGATDTTRGSWQQDLPALGEIRLFGGNFAPLDWMRADGARLPIRGYPELFEVIGTTYGGDGQVTFGLPDLPPVKVGDQELPYLVAHRGTKARTTGSGGGLQQGYLGEVRLWTGSDLPQGWLPCDGQELAIADHRTLFSIMGLTYGGDGRTSFKVPQLPAVGSARYLINVDGVLPPEQTGTSQSIAGGGEARGLDPMYAQIRLFAGTYVPAGWRPCDGQIYRIAENTPLFSLLGNRFGGDGRSNFAVPKMTLEANPDVRYAIAIQGIYPARP